MSRRRIAPLAFALGVVATLVALAVHAAGMTALDTWLYARWQRPVAPSGNVLVVTRDGTAGEPDAAMLAQLLGRLSRAGAGAIALDPALTDATATVRGGAAAEALLRQTIAESGRVVLAIRVPSGPPTGIGGDARAVGHVAGEAKRGIAAVPLFLDLDGRRVPALGLVLAAVASHAEIVVDRHQVQLEGTGLQIPIDARGRALLRETEPLATLTLAALVQDSDADRLQGLVNGKIVVIRGEASGDGLRLQAQLSNAILTAATLRLPPAAATWIVVLALTSVTAWLWLTRPWWVGLVDAVGFALVIAGSVGLLLALGTVAPLTAPLAGLAAASVGALAVRHVAGRQRLSIVESELSTIRDALVRQESTVETLEEDLEAARAAVARSTGAERDLVRAAEALRAQLAEARAQEAETRLRLDALTRESQAAAPVGEPDDACARVGIVTRDPAMLALFRDLERAARSTLPILILGEPGTGKELFARATHRLSPRAAQPFVAVNMAAIPPDLFESELFGHVRGSFTGAVADRKGWLEQADRGTIFLDEIGELRADQQSKLLRALQEKSFHRVGAVRPTAVDVRVVTASNRDLERGVAEGWFREDLYFRLKGLVLRLPALRARRGDVPLLAARILSEAAAELKRPGLALSEAALAALERHDWPGNVRELQNCLRQAAALADRPVLGPEDLRLAGTARSVAVEARDSDGAVLDALRRHRFDMQATARELGWDRSTVTQRLKGLGFRALVEAGGDPARAAAELGGEPALSRTVEVKLREYHEHLLRTIAACASADDAVAACRRRFKNLPERHFRSLELLVRRHFDRPRG